MSQKLVSTKFPFLPLHVHARVTGRHSIDVDTEALVDTGFSGDVLLPAAEEFKRYPASSYATWSMADGSEVMAPIFLGSVQFPGLSDEAGTVVGVTVTVLGNQALIGQSLLRRFTLTLDHGRRVILEP